METIRFWQGRKYWYVTANEANRPQHERVHEIHITNGNVATVNSAGDVPDSFEVFGRLRIENGVAYIEGF